MALSEHDAKILARFQGAEAVVGTNPVTGCDTVSLGGWYGEVVMTEHSIIYGPFGNQREWELGWGTSEDVSGSVKWAINETRRMMEQDRDNLVAKLLAQRDTPAS